MKLIFYIERIEMIQRLIQQRSTGSPSEMAKRLNISVSRLSRIIEELRDQGAPIRYDRQLKTYYYSEPYEIRVSVLFERK